MRTLSFFSSGSRPANPARVVGALAVSLALHALLLWAYRLGRMAPPAARPQAPETLTVWIRAAPQAMPPMPASSLPTKASEVTHNKSKREPLAAAAPPYRRAATMPPGAARPDAARPDVARSDAVSAEVSTEAVGVPPAEEGAAPPSPRPGFDIEAARKMARTLATRPDPARAATAVGQIPAQPIADETPLARHIGQAKRGDCKDGVPGGLLAPLLLLMDKKDSGCKM